MLWGENRGKWKGRQLPGVEPRTPLTWAPSALPLSLDSRMTTNPHNPLCILYCFFTFLYFCLKTSKFIYFQHEARCSLRQDALSQPGLYATQVLVARSSSNGDTVAVCGQFLLTFQRNVVYMLKRLWDGSRLFRVSWVLIMWFIITVLKLMKLVIGLHFDLVDITTTRISH